MVGYIGKRKQLERKKTMAYDDDDEEDDVGEEEEYAPPPNIDDLALPENALKDVKAKKYTAATTKFYDEENLGDFTFKLEITSLSWTIHLKFKL
jgi:hypothetical protein